MLALFAATVASALGCGGSSVRHVDEGSGATDGSACVQPPCPAPVDCPGGELIQPECGCPHCTAALPGCELVICPPDASDAPCPPDSVWFRPSGACCGACMPVEVSCVEIACPALTCAPGFAPGDGVSACCDQCVPDPKYCETYEDCFLAKRVDDCCGCPIAVSVREFNEDPCLISDSSHRVPPTSCGVPSDCDAPCECPEWGNFPECSTRNQCMLVIASLK